ncbi:hypothetical protein [Corynebacterium vitaeruminis]|uniref:hypothetical protein n=1 Tax=Corynebacterium vitaeruminis TaxID=38305 RepID=UPI0006902348|nr:hypothetical protein [Corynebacterium vitaeruminis]
MTTSPYRIRAIHQSLVDRLSTLSPGSSFIALVRGAQGSGKTQVIRDITANLTGWNVASASATPSSSRSFCGAG